ncbi:winged helix DNA-binding domain-containing protein [Tessaracoccus oleiagri]|uniref:Winged helix DNA-binding domain-containing protein n=1 Tax=Tessaracoccus oleiagri TaxID=686624 RepID=A0A1G9MYY6_9ACTN|nr:winged helix DNA-binding domain-containing protein [Tessaracoccus oleiagri]SDL79211.1 Winged helix DNA-binding domain-containing protein [Tessaracoccus oleiagri]
MPDRTLARSRLVAQGLVDRPYASPLDAVSALGLMQGQDLPGVLASTALRTRRGGVDEVLAALDARTLVRGYPMRGTVFLAPAADLRWMTELCAPPTLRAAAQRRARNHDFGDDAIERAFEVVAPHAAGDGVSRARYQELLRSVGIDPSGGRAYHILFVLIADGRLVHGPWNGSDQQIVLASETLGPGIADRFGGDETAAIGELASRYFRTRGPATIADFAWWTKLPLARIRRAVPLLADDVEALGDETFAAAGLHGRVADLARAAAAPLLLPGFDEFILGYKDRLFAMDEATHRALVPGNNGVFRRSIVVDGVVRGFWTRGGRNGSRTLEVTETEGVPKAAQAGVRRRFAEFPFVAP